MTDEKRLESLGFRPADMLLPKKDVDPRKWAVVACDQYTSEPDYWLRVSEYVGEDPSTLRIIYPEVWLEEDDKEERIKGITEKMREYLSSGVFDEYEDSFVLVERTTETGTRFGLMAALDLEKYDFSKDSVSLIRATEGTILERIPPRKQIRKDALLETPHIMVLISDDERSVIEPLRDRREGLRKIYDTDLMEKGGHLRGYLVDSDEDKERIYSAFEALHGRLDPENPLLFAMGDGNHSLATAKSIWEDIRPTLTEEERKDHPARFALVEIENIYDEGLSFEPIHRVFFGLSQKDFIDECMKHMRTLDMFRVENISDLWDMINEPGPQKFGYIDRDGMWVCDMVQPTSFLAAGTMQSVIDGLLKRNACRVDYIHGLYATKDLAEEDGNCGVILPDISKDTFFESILKDRAFPRKTFSIGHANEKRYYMEARKIVRD